MAFCKNCGNQFKEDDKFCPNCGSRVTGNSQASYQQAVVEMGQSSSSNYGDRGAYHNSSREFSHLSHYYQEQFSKIDESNEVYKGKWNWAAFFFGVLWAFSKGLWLSAVIAIIGSILTSGVIGFIYCIVMGIRGNYMYYNLVVKKKQMII